MSRETIKSNILKIKDPGSAITHFIAMALAILAAGPLLIKAARDSGQFRVTALAIFIVSMILLYAASTTYHTLDISPKINQMLRKLDHMMIFILIAGTYTPVCMIVLGDKVGWFLLGLVWTIAIAGIIIKACWITCPNGFPLSYISPWAGYAFWPLPELFRRFLRLPLAGFWPAALFTPLAVSFMP